MGEAGNCIYYLFFFTSNIFIAFALDEEDNHG